ncbi:unnamed protein product [Schistosoma mattheei]|uniref:Uncharacterized protein n=1 Tax=Schistosoma mattheei TaxID=31246 RepID=A0A183Q876_9TREM|nr:unnamed protein product [Schistosoma mattheei]
MGKENSQLISTNNDVLEDPWLIDAEIQNEVQQLISHASKTAVSSNHSQLNVSKQIYLSSLSQGISSNNHSPETTNPFDCHSNKPIDLLCPNDAQLSVDEHAADVENDSNNYTNESKESNQCLLTDKGLKSVAGCWHLRCISIHILDCFDQ